MEHPSRVVPAASPETTPSARLNRIVGRARDRYTARFTLVDDFDLSEILGTPRDEYGR